MGGTGNTEAVERLKKAWQKGSNLAAYLKMVNKLEILKLEDLDFEVEEIEIRILEMMDKNELDMRTRGLEEKDKIMEMAKQVETWRQWWWR